MKCGKLLEQVARALEGKACPTCGSDRIACLYYGEVRPDAETRVLIAEGKIVDGGRKVGEPNYYCHSCEKGFMDEIRRAWFEDRKWLETATEAEKKDYERKIKRAMVRKIVNPDLVEGSASTSCEPDPLHPFWEQMNPCAVCGNKVQMRLMVWMEGAGSVCHKCRLKRGTK
jgi:hypothetical protein